MRNTTGKYPIHFFRAELAAKYGVPAAIILNHIHYWISYYEKTNDTQKYKDGRYWTYGSRAYFENLMPYYGGSTISRYLSKLEKEGLINSSSAYNKKPYDKTKWYTLSDFGWTLFDSNHSCNLNSKDNSQPSTQNEQTSTQNEQTIPYISTYDCTTLSAKLSSQQVDDLISVYKSRINPNPTQHDINQIIELAESYGLPTCFKAINKSNRYGGMSIQYIAKVAASIYDLQNKADDSFENLLNMLEGGLKNAQS